MSQANVEVMRGGIDAWNRADRDQWLAVFAPEAEWHTTGRFADRGVYCGREELASYWAEFREDIEEAASYISEIWAVGDKVFVAATASGRGRRSKARFETPVWFVTTFRDGQVVQVETYDDPDQALEAAGLGEQDPTRDASRSSGAPSTSTTRPENLPERRSTGP
jgi:ketosteroid isomerase-like protein